MDKIITMEIDVEVTNINKNTQKLVFKLPNELYKDYKTHDKTNISITYKKSYRSIYLPRKNNNLYVPFNDNQSLLFTSYNGFYNIIDNDLTLIKYKHDLIPIKYEDIAVGDYVTYTSIDEPVESYSEEVLILNICIKTSRGLVYPCKHLIDQVFDDDDNKYYDYYLIKYNES